MNRPREYVIRDWKTRLELDGHKVLDVRGRPLPMVKVGHNDWTLFTVRPMPVEDVTWPDVPLNEIWIEQVQRAAQVSQWHHDVALALTDLERRHAEPGYRFIRLWAIVRAHLSIVRPDLVALKDGRATAVWVLKGTTQKIREKLRRLSGFDEVAVIEYHGSVWRPDDAPTTRVRRFGAPLPSRDPLTADGTAREGVQREGNDAPRAADRVRLDVPTSIPCVVEPRFSLERDRERRSPVETKGAGSGGHP